MKTAPSDAVRFVMNIAKTFPIFDDVSIYKGDRVYFYKKAQLFAHDMMTGFAHTPYAMLKNIDTLTGEADYKIPSLLRKLGILVYNQNLAAKVDQRVELLADSPEEVEIRANMLWACHLMCGNLFQKRHMTIDSVTLDGILWVASQTKSPDDKPYHLTITTDY
jgi:hypothetical protein